MDTRTTSYAKEVTLDSEKPNQLDAREGITQEFNNNSSPFILQENSGRTNEGAQKGERSDEGNQGRESFNSAAANEPKTAGHDQRMDGLKERYSHLKQEQPESSRELSKRKLEGDDLANERLDQLKDRYENQPQTLEKEEKSMDFNCGNSL